MPQKEETMKDMKKGSMIAVAILVKLICSLISFGIIVLLFWLFFAGPFSGAGQKAVNGLSSTMGRVVDTAQASSFQEKEAEWQEKKAQHDAQMEQMSEMQSKIYSEAMERLGW